MYSTSIIYPGHVNESHQKSLLGKQRVGDIHGKVQLILLGGIEIENNCRHQQVTGNFVDLISNRLMGN